MLVKKSDRALNYKKTVTNNCVINLLHLKEFGFIRGEQKENMHLSLILFINEFGHMHAARNVHFVIANTCVATKGNFW